jgi:hypothetical protein
MKRNFKNYELIINDDQTRELIFDRYKVLEYKTKKSIEKYKTNFYMIDLKKGYGHNRVSAVYTKEKDLKEFYFDNSLNFFKSYIKNNQLIISEISRANYLKIIKKLKENIGGAA